MCTTTRTPVCDIGLDVNSDQESRQEREHELPLRNLSDSVVEIVWELAAT